MVSNVRVDSKCIEIRREPLLHNFYIITMHSSLQQRKLDRRDVYVRTKMPMPTHGNASGISRTLALLGRSLPLDLPKFRELGKRLDEDTRQLSEGGK